MCLEPPIGPTQDGAGIVAQHLNRDQDRNERKDEDDVVDGQHRKPDRDAEAGLGDGGDCGKVGQGGRQLDCPNSPECQARPPLVFAVGSLLRAKDFRLDQRRAASTRMITPATSSITCLAVAPGRGMSARSSCPRPSMINKPASRFTANTPTMNPPTWRRRWSVVARYRAGATVEGFSESPIAIETTRINLNMRPTRQASLACPRRSLSTFLAAYGRFKIVAACRSSEAGSGGSVGRCWSVCKLVDSHGDGEEQGQVLALRDLDSIGFANPHPLLGDGCDHVAVALDLVLVVEDVSLGLEVLAVLDLDVDGRGSRRAPCAPSPAPGRSARSSSCRGRSPPDPGCGQPRSQRHPRERTSCARASPCRRP